MAYFISIGRFKGLKSGVGSRGWQIWRRGKAVRVRWGPIDVLRGYPKRFVWAAECEPNRYTFRTEKAAREERQRRIRQKTTGTLGSRDSVYQPLPKGQKIHAKRSTIRD
jgi:hypothetical protein